MKYAIHYQNEVTADPTTYVEYVPRKRDLRKTEEWLRKQLNMTIVGIYACLELKEGAKQ